MAQSEKKYLEAEKLMKEADKLTTKTLFRWKPDWESASTMYENAGTYFKNAKVPERAKDAFIRAANCFENMNLGFSAGKNYDAAAMMAKDLNSSEEAADLYEKASMFYRQENSPDKAAETLLKASKCVEDLNPDRAIQLSIAACDLYQEEEKELFSGQAFRSTISLLLRNNKIIQTIELLTKQQTIFEKTKNTHDLHKNFLSLIVLHLHRGDSVAANLVWETSCSNYPDFPVTKEGKASAELLDAFERSDPEALQKCVKQQVFEFLDNQIAKLAKGLKITGGGTEKEDMS
jgi:tetratricopeptide (TPR) repeat protein